MVQRVFRMRSRNMQRRFYFLILFMIILFTVRIFFGLIVWNKARANRRRNQLKASSVSMDNSLSKARDCHKNLSLRIIEQNDVPLNPAFFLNTGNLSYLTPRQACAVESTHRNSGKIPVVLMSRDVLEVQKNNATCFLYSKLRINFFTYDFATLANNTPLEKATTEVENSDFPAEHFADMLRQLIIYQFGGTYLDLDFIILKKLTNLRNTIVMTNKNRNMDSVMAKNETCKANGTSEQGYLTNGYFQLDKGHPLTWEVIESMGVKFKRHLKRTSIGPLLTTTTFLSLYKTSYLSNFKSANIQVLPTFTFFPIGSHAANENLWSKTSRSTKDWENMFACSYGVHFFSHLTNDRKVKRNEKHEAYSYLAKKHCPFSFFSRKHF